MNNWAGFYWMKLFLFYVSTDDDMDHVMTLNRPIIINIIMPIVNMFVSVF